MTRPPLGKRAASTRLAIGEAAATLFADQGFTATSVREIARAANVDPALVIRYYGSKEALFLETMSLDTAFDGLAEAPLDGLGRTMVERLLSRHGGSEQQSFYRALMRAAERDDVRAYLVSLEQAYIVGPLAGRLPGGDAEVRAALISAQISGLLTALWTLEDPVLLSAPTSTIVEIYGRTLQRLIDDPADDGTPPTA